MEKTKKAAEARAAKLAAAATPLRSLSPKQQLSQPKANNAVARVTKAELFSKAEDFVAQVQDRFQSLKQTAKFTMFIQVCVRKILILDTDNKFQQQEITHPCMLLQAIRSGQQNSYNLVEAQVLSLLDGHPDLVEGLYDFLPNNLSTKTKSAPKSAPKSRPDAKSKTQPAHRNSSDISEDLLNDFGHRPKRKRQQPVSYNTESVQVVEEWDGLKEALRLSLLQTKEEVQQDTKQEAKPSKKKEPSRDKVLPRHPSRDKVLPRHPSRDRVTPQASFAPVPKTKCEGGRERAEKRPAPRAPPHGGKVKKVKELWPGEHEAIRLSLLESGGGEGESSSTSEVSQLTSRKSVPLKNGTLIRKSNGDPHVRVPSCGRLNHKMSCQCHMSAVYTQPTWGKNGGGDKVKMRHSRDPADSESCIPPKERITSPKIPLPRDPFEIAKECALRRLPRVEHDLLLGLMNAWGENGTCVIRKKQPKPLVALEQTEAIKPEAITNTLEPESNDTVADASSRFTTPECTDEEVKPDSPEVSPSTDAGTKEVPSETPKHNPLEGSASEAAWSDVEKKIQESIDSEQRAMHQNIDEIYNTGIDNSKMEITIVASSVKQEEPPEPCVKLETVGGQEESPVVLEEEEEDFFEGFDETMLHFMRRERIGVAMEVVDPTSTLEWYHSANFVKVSQEELEVNSEDELDDSWINENDAKLLDQFTDVGQSDKNYMMLWNKFAFKEQLIADWDMMAATPEFIRRYGDVIYKQHRSCFTLHLLNLHELGILKPEEIEQMLSLAKTVSEGGELPEEYKAPPDGVGWREYFKIKLNADRTEKLQAEAILFRQKMEERHDAGLDLQRNISSGSLSIREREEQEVLLAEELARAKERVKPKRQRHASNKLATALQTTSDSQLMQSVLRNSIYDH